MADKMAEFVDLENDEQGHAYSRPASPSSNPRQHRKCRERVDYACRRSLSSVTAPYVKFMLEAMKKMGCEVDPDRHIICEPCEEKLMGGFDPERKEIFLCENTVYSQQAMDDVLTHELIHAYDYCRVKYDPENLRHLACTEIRAANLSGDCFFWKENFGRFRFGWKAHQQDCVKHRAVRSILCVRDIRKKDAEEIVNSVFDTCFHDTDPFERIPP